MVDEPFLSCRRKCTRVPGVDQGRGGSQGRGSSWVSFPGWRSLCVCIISWKTAKVSICVSVLRPPHLTLALKFLFGVAYHLVSIFFSEGDTLNLLWWLQDSDIFYPTPVANVSSWSDSETPSGYDLSIMGPIRKPVYQIYFKIIFPTNCWLL